MLSLVLWEHYPPGRKQLMPGRVLPIAPERVARVFVELRLNRKFMGGPNNSAHSAGRTLAVGLG